MPPNLQVLEDARFSVTRQLGGMKSSLGWGTAGIWDDGMATRVFGGFGTTFLETNELRWQKSASSASEADRSPLLHFLGSASGHTNLVS